MDTEKISLTWAQEEFGGSDADLVRDGMAMVSWRAENYCGAVAMGTYALQEGCLTRGTA